MKSSHRTHATLVAIGLALGGVGLCPAAPAASSEYDNVIHPGPADGSCIWNRKAQWFMYAPVFAFKTVAGAVKYRFTVLDDKQTKLSFVADRPTASLVPVWSKLPTGFVTVTCEGVDASGRIVGKAGERKFWKAAGFREGTYQKAAKSYRETALGVYRYIFNMKETQYLLKNGKPDASYELNTYVSKMCSSLIRGMIRYGELEPEKRETALAVARAAADHLIRKSEPAGAPLAFFPPTYDGRGEKDNGYIAEKFKGQIMLCYPASVAMAFLDLAKATGEARYRESAEQIAGTYLKLQGTDGTWNLKMWAKDGTPVCKNRLVPIQNATPMFERLYAETGKTEYRAAADRSFASLEGRLADWNWEGQFEDVVPTARYENLTKHDACSTAIYLAKRFPNDPARRAQVRELLRFAEDQFVCWEPPYKGKPAAEVRRCWAEPYDDWMTPCALEQYNCYVPIDASAAKLIRTYLAAYRLEGRSEDLAKARALGDTATRVQCPDGRIPTWWWPARAKLVYADWINCMIGTAEALLELNVAVSDPTPRTEAPGWPVLKSYEGEHLRRVKMPLGGIGTGTVSLSGTGGLVDWEIRNRPDKGCTPSSSIATCFALRTETADGRVAARLLEGPVDSSEYEGESGATARNHGFARWRDCTFKAAYPLAQVALADPAMPVRATLEAMNPLIPGDADASGIPAALLRWKISNPSAAPVRASVICYLVNFEGGAEKLSRVSEGGLTGVRLVSDGKATNDVNRGEMALALPDGAGEISVSTHLESASWITGFDGIWRAFVASGCAGDYRDDESKGTMRPMAAVCVRIRLKPGETKSLPFALGWRFPHRYAWSKTDAVGNWYATRSPTALAAACDLLTNLPRYETATVGFVNGVLARRAPDVVKEAALFNLSTLRTETCFRTADGHFYGWEGCFDKAGSCHGNCTHVWGYEHTLVDLWPALAKDMTELQFGPAMDDRGCISFRIGLPLATDARKWTTDAADGHCQCFVKAYENWKKTGDDAWMKKLWPRIRKATEFIWMKDGWDGDKDGVMEGSQHNTMDVEYFGPNPQMEFLYLAALRAVAAMADAAGDGAFASDCRALAEKGSAWTEKNLFNGAYYEHKVVPMTAQPLQGTFSGLFYSREKLSNPDYQLAAGCLVDQLVGDYAARAVGLGPVADEAHAAKTLDTILAKNASANVAASFNPLRDFALQEEPALKMAWYPPERMPKKPFPYYRENMTGFEYVVAANLAQRGRFAEAEKVVRDIRSRYDGRKRSPFDEAECGHHYARALDAWSVLMAFSQTRPMW